MSITHQDDSTKVNLPHATVDSSADITLWRCGVNSNVNAISGASNVFSYDQGRGPKNSSAIVETIVLEHVLNCQVEGIKILVSDNASVGKKLAMLSCITAISSRPGACRSCFIVFLENNHGNWLADILFGQFQLGKRSSIILRVDQLLQEFESINIPKHGPVKGFCLNLLSSVDFVYIFEGLGYETKPPKDFGFDNRDIHFAVACGPGVERRMDAEVLELFPNALSDHEGMVRVFTNPPSRVPNEFRKFEDRWADVPAAALFSSSKIALKPIELKQEAPLVVSLEQDFVVTGKCVVSKKTAEHVGYNGLCFLDKAAFLEMRAMVAEAVKEAWPENLLRAGPPGFELESIKWPPDNWILRRSLAHYKVGSCLRPSYPPT